MRLKRPSAVIAPAAALTFAVAVFISEGTAGALIFLVLVGLFLLRHRSLKHSISLRGR